MILEITKDQYINLGINDKKKGVKKLNWIKRHIIIITIVTLTLTFSIINIILIIKFFYLLANL